MSDKNSLVKIVEDKESKHSGSAALAIIEFVGIGACVFNPVIGFGLAVSAMAMQAYEKKQSLDECRMPDDWLVSVSKSGDISKEGISYLAKCIDKKGYVSVSDALNWVEIEKKVDGKAVLKNTIDDGRSQVGASMILNRAVNECGFKKTIAIGKEFVSDSIDVIGEKAGGLINEAASFIKRKKIGDKD